MEKCVHAACDKVMGVKAVLAGTVLMALLLQPTLQFTLVHRTKPNTKPQHPHVADDSVTSVHGKLAARDNPASHHHHSHHHHHRPSHQHVDGVTDRLLIPPTAGLLNVARGAQPAPPAYDYRGNTNRGKTDFLTRPRFGVRPSESGAFTTSKPNVEAPSFGRPGSTTTTKSRVPSRKQVVVVVVGADGKGQAGNAATPGDHQPHFNTDTDAGTGRDVPFTKVVQVEWDGHPLQRAEIAAASTRVQRKSSGKGASGGTEASKPESHALSVLDSSNLAELEEGEWQTLQQQALPTNHQVTHVSKMVLTAIGSLTAIAGVCVMAAIFQCCCRRKRGSSSSEEEEKDKKDQKSYRSSRSKSPSPQKVVTKEGEEDQETEKGQSEQDKLLEEDEDLGDFSAVQRETEILRSYRKPPPPKNRARASRVPRALKTVDPKASPDVFQELVENEEAETSRQQEEKKHPKPANGLASTELVPDEMQSSMLADIDSTLAALHSEDDKEKSASTPSPTKSADRSREPSAEKVLTTNSDSSRLKPPSKEPMSTSPSKEELARVLAQELSRSVSKEMLSKPQRKTPSPTASSKESQSGGTSPKTSSKNVSASPSKDSVGSGNGNSSGSSVGGGSGEGAGSSSEEGKKKEAGNFFALIDPTVKDKGGDASSRSKIPVRAASSPTQPSAPLRPASLKEKRFPVPSVHGDQMDQLLKSLKTRLKEDDKSSSKKASNKVSPKEDSADEDDLDPQGRDRSHSDPTNQHDKGDKPHQTHL